jgi:CDGSH-type Zn-finger protein
MMRRCDFSVVVSRNVCGLNSKKPGQSWSVPLFNHLQSSRKCSSSSPSSSSSQYPKIFERINVNNLSSHSEVTVGKEIRDKRTSFCRCWQSKTFPICDGAHKEWNALRGEKLGPLRVFLPEDLVEKFKPQERLIESGDS